MVNSGATLHALVGSPSFVGASQVLTSTHLAAGFLAAKPHNDPLKSPATGRHPRHQLKACRCCGARHATFVRLAKLANFYRLCSKSCNNFLPSAEHYK